MLIVGFFFLLFLGGSVGGLKVLRLGSRLEMGLRFVGTMMKFLKCRLTLTPWGRIFLVQLTF